MTGKAPKGEGAEKAQQILYSGKAFKKFKEIIKAQGGNLGEIKLARFKKDFLSKKTGKIIEIDNKKINSLARIVGCPVDKFAGLYIYHNTGEKIKKRTKILTIYSETRTRLRQAVRFYKKENPIRIK